MDEETRELLNGIFVYAEILNHTNRMFQELINQNTEKQLNENERLFYEISSEIMRLIPIKKVRGVEGVLRIDTESGILLLKDDIPFLLEDYNRIIQNEKYVKILLDMSKIRNKFIHEPHNIQAGFYVGGKTSCSMGLSYKNELCSISTITITYIIYELNLIFEKLKELFLKKADECGDRYKEYPCYQTMGTYNFKKYNDDYPMLPLCYLETCDE